MIKLNLGSGRAVHQDSVNIDHHLFPGVNIIANLEDGLPIKDNSIDYIYSKDCFEHIANITKLFCEVYRVLRTDGILHIIVPYYTGQSACQCIDHKIFFTHDSMMPFANLIDKGGWDLGTGDVCFWGISMQFNYYSGAEEFCRKLGITLEEGVRFLNNMVDTIEWKMMKK